LITTTIGTTQTAIYRLGPFTATATTTFLVLTNVSLQSDDNTVSLTVGRASTPAATNILSTNIVNNLSPLTLPQPGAGTYNYYMASGKPRNNVNFNLCGSALDKPGAGTVYYTIWMQSDNSYNYVEMAVSLIVLQVVP
jgi:hypothetical protein